MPPAPDSDAPDIPRLTAWLREMLLIRRFEEKAGQLYGMGLIGGYCHLSVGQEAVAVGLGHALRAGDKRIASYRAHGHMLAAGMAPDRIMAELAGRATGYSGGKGGSMHMAAPEQDFFGGHAMLAAQVPIGAGLAFAEAYRGSRNATLCVLGETAALQGQVAETYHLARLWALPILFVIENNQIAPGQPRPPKGTGLTDRAAACGIPARIVDGMDVEAVHGAAQDALLDIRAGKGPRLLEAQTYRYRGHALADPEQFRNLDEMRRVRAERDPIERLRQRLLAAGADEAALKTYDAEVKAQVAEAAEAARAAPEPDPGALMTHVVAEG